MHLLMQAYTNPERQVTVASTFFKVARLIILVPQYGIALCYPAGTWNIEVSARLPGNLCTPVLVHCG